MKGWTRRTWIGCVVALACGASLAHADGGRIDFVGAVVEPTCSLHDQALAGADLSSFARTHWGTSCGDRAEASPTHSPSYAMSVESVGTSAMASDRVLAYFSNYLQAAGLDGVDARLVTQSYL